MILYQEGGSTNPYITSDPDDPRIQAYQDSLNAYGYGERSFKFGKSIYDNVRDASNSEFRKYYDMVQVENPDTTYVYVDTGLKPISGYNEYPVRKPLTIYEKIFGDNAPNYYLGENGEHWEPNGTFWNRWKKPEQEVIYQPQEDQEILGADLDPELTEGMTQEQINGMVRHYRGFTFDEDSPFELGRAKPALQPQRTTHTVENVPSRTASLNNSGSAEMHPQARTAPEIKGSQDNLRRHWSREKGWTWTYGPEEFGDEDYHKYEREGMFKNNLYW